MRKPRALVFDDEPAVLAAVSLYFEAFGWEVVGCTEPAPCAGNESSGPCRLERPCADVVVTDLAMPGTNGVELLAAQALRGCPLAPANKALLSGSLDAGHREAARRAGYACFGKPIRLEEFRQWLAGCEQRVDLAQPLGVLRRERREACAPGRWVTIAGGDEVRSASVLNTSRQGICLRTDRPLAPEQVVDVRHEPAAAPRRLVVRWAQGCVAGGIFEGPDCG